ncbi:MAG TPA: hypothetical protein VF755_29060 [Catenuloplanes sp.]|jgi:hypothetical protein
MTIVDLRTRKLSGGRTHPLDQTASNAVDAVSAARAGANAKALPH